jgi:hypothetical protein
MSADRFASESFRRVLIGAAQIERQADYPNDW